jgi:hypothetical protein
MPIPTITAQLQKQILSWVAKGGVGGILVLLLWGYSNLRDHNRLDFQYQLEKAEARETAYLSTINSQELKALEKGFYFLSSSRRQSPLPEWAKGASGHYQWKNEAFDKWLLIPNGINVDSVIFHTDMEIWADKDLAKTYRENDLKVLREERVIHAIEYARINDEIVAWHAWKFPIRNALNKVIGVGGIAVQQREITDPNFNN